MRTEVMDHEDLQDKLPVEKHQESPKEEGDLSDERKEAETPAAENPVVVTNQENPVPAPDMADGDTDAANAEIQDKTAASEASPEATSAAGDNVSYMNAQLVKLSGLKDSCNFVDFWFYVKEINKSLFTIRGLNKDQRHHFKDRIGELCNEVKQLQDVEKARVAKTSHLKLERVQQILDEALAFGTTPEDLERSFMKIDEANKFLKDGKIRSPDGEESEGMSREHREQAKQCIKEARDKIFDRKRAVREENFKKVTKKLDSISDSLMSNGRAQKVFDGIKNLRNEMKGMNLDRQQMRDIDNLIEIMWKKAREKASSRQRQDAKSHIIALQDSVKRKEVYITTLEKEIKDLGVKWKNVQNDFFKNRVDEWIVEKNEKIEAVKKEIAGVQEKISFLQEQQARSKGT